MLIKLILLIDYNNLIIIFITILVNDDDYDYGDDDEMILATNQNVYLFLPFYV